MTIPRVVHVIMAYPPDYTGQGRQVESLLPHLHDIAIDARVVCSRLHEDRGSEIRDGVERLPCRGGAMRRTDFANRFAGWCVRRRASYDILVFQGIDRFTLIGIFLCWLLGKRSIVVTTLVGDDDVLTIQKTRGGAFKMWILRRADRFVALSSAIAEDAKAAGIAPKKIRRIPQGVDADRFAPPSESVKTDAKRSVCRDAGWPQASQFVVFIGAIIRRKGVDVLARAWPLIVEACPNAKLLLVGPETGISAEFSADFVTEIKDSFRNAGVQASIRFAGLASEPERYLQIGDAFVLPSRNEGLPNAVVEAMAAGLPCVVTDLPGITSDMIDSGTDGEIVPQEDSVSLARAVIGLLQEPARATKIGQAARRKAVDRFSMRIVARQTVELYRELMEQKR